MKLIALDLDGTLLSSNKTIRPSDRDMIFEAQNQGHIVSICSGRGIQDCLGILDDAGIDCPIISGNGAVVYDGEKIIAEYHLQPELIHEITSILIEGNVYFELYENNGIQIFSKGREILEKEIDLLSSRQKDFPIKWAHEQIEIQYEQKGLILNESYQHMKIDGSTIYKILIVSFDPKKIQTVQRELSKKPIYITPSEPTKLEIVHADVHKGKGLTILANHLNIPLANTVAIGDNYNDLPMLKVAGVSIAMGNAEEEVKNICDYVTLTNDESGVAYALEKYILKNDKSTVGRK